MKVRVHNLLLVAALALTTSACAKGVSARMPSASPASSLALDVPTPPARTLVPVTLVVEAPPEPPPAPPPAPPRTRETPAPRTTPAPDRPAAAAAAPTAPAEPAAVLQPTANVAAIEARTLQLLGKAEKDLARLQPSTLQPNARAQFDSARGFIKGAADAIKIKNFVYAELLANKAAEVAAALVK